MTDKGNLSTSTQYNEIATGYAVLYPAGGKTCETYPIATVEAHQLFKILSSDPTFNIKGKRVLDLACGNGYYTSKFLEWGASHVTGVDISQGMLDIAKADAKDRNVDHQLSFVAADLTDPNTLIDGGPFDLVTGCWFLNYASDSDVMKKMWTVIGRNLKTDGAFVGLTLPPFLTDATWEAELADQCLSTDGVWGRLGCAGQILEAVKEGHKVRYDLGLAKQGHEIVSFETYYLRLDVFETSCKSSGFFDGLEWCDFEIPREVKHAFELGYWNELSLRPHCRVCVARKKAVPATASLRDSNSQLS